MSLTSIFLYKLSALCRCRVINGPDHKPYLERYHVLRLPFGYQIYLHRFVASDPGRGLHNHPWKRALSLVLSGGYEETRMLGAAEDNALHTRWLRAGSFNLISGETFHRVNLADGHECWSLFIHAPRAKGWGFIEGEGYRDHDEVVGQHGNPQWWKNAPRPIHHPGIRLPCPV